MGRWNRGAEWSTWFEDSRRRKGVFQAAVPPAIIKVYCATMTACNAAPEKLALSYSLLIKLAT